MARTVKTLNVTAVINGEHGSRPQASEKAEDFIRDSIVAKPEISQNELLSLVGVKFPTYGYSSFKIAYSRYTAVMREVKSKYDIKIKTK